MSSFRLHPKTTLGSYIYPTPMLHTLMVGRIFGQNGVHKLFLSPMYAHVRLSSPHTCEEWKYCLSYPLKYSQKKLLPPLKNIDPLIAGQHSPSLPCPLSSCCLMSSVSTQRHTDELGTYGGPDHGSCSDNISHIQYGLFTCMTSAR